MDALALIQAIQIDPLWVAVLALLVACLAVWLAMRTRARLHALEKQLRELKHDRQGLDTAILALHGAIKAVAEDVIDQGQHQSSVRRALDRLADQQSELRLRDVDEGLYVQAIELIRLGRGRSEVRQLCGLTQAEVDLLFSLHGASVARENPSVSR
jgi:septal ring factor EnvC (AmiA/AmiB activator)